MKTRRLLSAAPLALLVAVGLTGCMKMDMQFELQSDDTVDGNIVIAVASEYADMLGTSPEEFAEQLQAETVELEGTESLRTEAYDDGEYVGSRTIFEGQTLETFSMSDESDALRVVREGNDFVVSGALDMTDEAGDMGMLGGEFDIVIAFTFPGAVSSHDGSLSGTTVTWRPEAGERTEINARGSAVEGGAAGLPIWLLAVIGLAVLAVIAVVIVLVVRSGKKGSSSPVATAYPATAGAPQPPPTAGPPPPAPDAAAVPAAPPVADAPAEAPPAPPVADAPAEAPPAPPAADAPAEAPPAPPAADAPAEAPPAPPAADAPAEAPPAAETEAPEDKGPGA